MRNVHPRPLMTISGRADAESAAAARLLWDETARIAGIG